MTRGGAPRVRSAGLLIAAMLGTFAVLRAWLWFTPDADFDVLGYNIHHLFTGVLVTTACSIPLVLGMRSGVGRTALVAGFGVGLGMVLDEWVYLIATDGSNASYLLPVSFWGGLVVVLFAVAYTVVCAALIGRDDERRNIAAGAPSGSDAPVR